MNNYQMTIGIECHVQLATNTKLFSPADNDARGAEPNTKVHEIDFGLPGMLPQLNRRAVELAIKAGKALNAEVAHISRFDRKHYFYPDLPKGYQTTQMYAPIIIGGYVDAPLEGGETARVRIHHAHMEEDAGKLTHFAGYSLVDLNRAGTPLIEVVSEPDMHTAAEARAFATELFLTMKHAGVTHGDLYQGNMRFDVNISIAKKGAAELGKRAEVKNLNSFRGVEKAAEYEFARQVEILENGGEIVQETRGWNDDKMITTSQRSKEDAQDYRYMPDPDIPPIILSEDEIRTVQSTMAPLPADFRASWSQLKLDDSVVAVLLADPSRARTIQQVFEKDMDAARAGALWFMQSIEAGDLDTGVIIKDENEKKSAITAQQIQDIYEMVRGEKLNSNAAKQVFLIANTNNSAHLSPIELAERENLIQLNDSSAIETIIEEVLDDAGSQKAVEDIKSGNDKAIGFLVGQVMKKSQGKANPPMVQKIIRKKLS